MNTRVPTYALYGEDTAEIPEFWVHAESIASRSRLHGWEIKRHRHACLFQILHIRHGKGEALIGGEWHPFTAPAAIVVPERHEHGFRFSTDVDGAVITLMSKRLPARLPAHKGIAEWLSRPRLTQMPADHPDTPYIGETLNRIEGEITQAGNSPSPLLEAMLISTLLLVFRMGGATEAMEAGRDQVRFEQLTALINDGFRAHQPVTFYARELGVSVTHLNRIARAIAGKPVSHLVAERIISEAKRDLVFAGITIQQVADGLGFEDQAYFSRFFSRHAGLSPARYRDREQALLGG
ncbi:helix-turn-helix domain-containing protein [Ciceribacter thiooxidans]|uniref:Helix-turn-helix domain-containing protein n=1 Tax=Ciceribacter thiooxidans TaxID=1969821 RepID=A0ABV7I5C7_9HYPH|nr:helix-turn-helix domain-containing protein [Ciceribacter thiooxidans]MDI6836641.1 helix-turn-helix domain-containing protein [Rhizobiaceae bacterium]